MRRTGARGAVIMGEIGVNMKFTVRTMVYTWAKIGPSTGSTDRYTEARGRLGPMSELFGLQTETVILYYSRFDNRVGVTVIDSLNFRCVDLDSCST